MSVLDASFALILTRPRMIGTVFPDIVVREINRDDLLVTDHPVETGAAISDHAFLRPKEVEMVCGWSNSTGGFSGYIDLAYAQLRALQAEREPFLVITGKRVYRNMLMASLQVTTDERTENVLMVQCRLREVIITNTQQTAIPASAQANPQSTQSTASIGQVQATAYGFGRNV